MGFFILSEVYYRKFARLGKNFRFEDVHKNINFCTCDNLIFVNLEILLQLFHIGNLDNSIAHLHPHTIMLNLTESMAQACNIVV